MLVAAAKGLILRAACFEVSPEGSMKEEVDTMEGTAPGIPPPSPPLPLLAGIGRGEEGDSRLTILPSAAMGLPCPSDTAGGGGSVAAAVGSAKGI